VVQACKESRSSPCMLPLSRNVVGWLVPAGWLLGLAYLQLLTSLGTARWLQLQQPSPLLG
jgi:hypothetical protein